MGTRAQHRGAVAAFTLVELLIVMAIVATLATLTGMTAGYIRSTAHRVTCANNLNKIAQSPRLQLREFDPSVRGAFSTAERWILMTLQDAQDAAILRCPEGGNYFSISDRPPAAPLYSISGTIAIDISPSNSDPKRFEMITPSGTIDRKNIMAYSGPASSVQFTPQGATEVLLNGQPMQLDYHTATTVTGTSITVSLYNTSNNGKASSAWVVEIAATDAKITPGPSPSMVEAAPAAAAPTYYVSYGVNPNVVNTSGLGLGNVLAMDYEHLVVQPGDADWQMPTYPFARHRGLLNVLLRDGSVHVLAPEEVSPAMAENFAYWQPG
ncbi:MAG: prepilin-type N-terminal cleavage/methylation domain-containing protein [Planctomycetaceae bacterium]|nr:prepilin-type N-terminal cleavage/methylation domain-containing protein [Planctomycetaceae bacterium]